MVLLSVEWKADGVHTSLHLLPPAMCRATTPHHQHYHHYHHFPDDFFCSGSVTSDGRVHNFRHAKPSSRIVAPRRPPSLTPVLLPSLHPHCHFTPLQCNIPSLVPQAPVDPGELTPLTNAVLPGASKNALIFNAVRCKMLWRRCEARRPTVTLASCSSCLLCPHSLACLSLHLLLHLVINAFHLHPVICPQPPPTTSSTPLSPRLGFHILHINIYIFSFLLFTVYNAT